MTAVFEAIVDGVSKKKDGTMSIRLGTQELTPEQTAAVFTMGNGLVKVTFEEVELGNFKVNENGHWD